ncbi:MAG: hypothetical protein ACI8TF_002643, partial [Paracoccaceae bacterium]
HDEPVGSLYDFGRDYEPVISSVDRVLQSVYARRD